MGFSVTIVTQVMVLTSLPEHCRPLIFLKSSSYNEEFVSCISYQDMDQQYFDPTFCLHIPPPWIQKSSSPMKELVLPFLRAVPSLTLLCKSLRDISTRILKGHCHEDFAVLG